MLRRLVAALPAQRRRLELEAHHISTQLGDPMTAVLGASE
jgi:hypothetical protein